MATYMDTDMCYISTACNQADRCLSWGRNGVICFGSCQSIAVYEDSGPGVREIVHGHHGRVNVVQWISHPGYSHQADDDEDPVSPPPTHELVSGSVDGSAIVWSYGVTPEHQQPTLVKQAVLKGHTKSINAVDGIYTSRASRAGVAETLVATASEDSTLRLWLRREGAAEFACVQELSFGRGFALDVSLTVLPGTTAPILACASDDSNVYLYTAGENSEFSKTTVLSGHEDWVRGVEFASVSEDGANDLLLLSASQDSFIRIWRISSSSAASGEGVNDPEEIRLRSNTFVIPRLSDKTAPDSVVFSTSLEAVLTGHDNWVTSAHWQPAVYLPGGRQQPMCVVSSSMDKTMIVWRPDPDSGVWMDAARVGEVGGNTLGFIGCQFGPDGRRIIGHSFQASLHMWRLDESGTDETDLWLPCVTPSGHLGGVTDIEWEPRDGQYLVSVAKDQTTRLHGVWSRDGETSWHEIARPQIHGYDMVSVAAVNSYSFVSAGDEKVLRVFHAPQNFIGNFAGITGMSLNVEGMMRLAEGASVPALGLSNKAVYSKQGEDLTRDAAPHPNEQYPELYFSSVSLTKPPTEEHLLQNTLWPEIHKLYGHGNELYEVTCSSDGRLMASACKASKTDHAHVFVWDTSSWQPIAKLPGHSLTVTQLRFSHDSKSLLSVSRDRTWCLHKISAGPCFSLTASSDSRSKHSRIIWGCSWSHDDKYFVTGSRDKKVILWSVADGSVEMCDQLDMGDSVTAVDFAPMLSAVSSSYVVAMGLDNGGVVLNEWAGGKGWGGQRVIPSLCHSLTVTKVKWRPFASPQADSGQCLQLATCGMDHCVKICNIYL